MADSRYRRTRRRSVITRRRFVGGAGVAAAALVAACKGDTDSKQSQSGSGSGTGTTAKSEAVLPGQLTDAEKAQATSIETEYRLKYHYSKLQNLPGQKQGPKYGGVFRHTNGPPVSYDNLDPGAGSDRDFGMIYNGLVEAPLHDFHDVHRGIRPVGDLAEKWEQPDPETIVFTLREGVKFHDRPPLNGRALTVDDVRQSHEAYRKTPHLGPNYADVKSIEAVDNRRVKFTFNRPAAYFLNNLLSQRHVVIPPELLGTERSKTEAVGTGPMMLKSWKPGQTVELERNPSYFKKDERTGMQLPYLDGWQGQVYGDRTGILAAWRGGQLDHFYIGFGLREAKSQGIFEDPNAVYQVVSPSPWGQNHVVFKLDKAPWSDVRVRRALSLAIDRKELVSLPDGLAAEGSFALDWTYFKDPKTGEFQEWPWRPDQLGQYQRHDPGQAKQLLGAAGFTAQNPLEFEAIGVTRETNGLLRQETQLAVIDLWKQALGDIVKPRFTQQEPLVYARTGRTREFSDVYFAWTAGPAYEPDGFLYGLLHSKSSNNYYGINDPAIDRAAEAQRVELDNAKRQPLWQEVMDRDLDQVYRIFTYLAYKTMARRANVFNILDGMNMWAPGFRGGAQMGWKLS
jgi:peptide/nickel transport system substrate-binding protein